MSEKGPNKGKELLAQSRRAGREITLGIEAQIEACHQLSAKKRLAEVFLFACLYAAGALFCLAGPHIYSLNLLGVLPMALAMNSLGILIHEGLHGLLAKGRALNHICSFLCGLPLLISASAYRATHNDHHLDFGRKLDYGTYRQHLNNRYFVWAAYYAQLFFGTILYILLIPALALRTASTAKRLRIILEYCLIIAIAAAFVQSTSTETALLLWAYPGLIAMMTTNIRGLASHALGDLDDIYLSSRSIPTSRLVEILFLHENYHLEHHLFPQVPSYHLKKVHQLVWDRLPRALYARSYLAFLAAFLKASLSLNLACCGLVHPKEPFAPKAF
ncbi:MAG: fatty acid desaturase family protein [Opitutales bacterium]